MAALPKVSSEIKPKGGARAALGGAFKKTFLSSLGSKSRRSSSTTATRSDPQFIPQQSVENNKLIEKSIAITRDQNDLLKSILASLNNFQIPDPDLSGGFNFPNNDIDRIRKRSKEKEDRMTRAEDDETKRQNQKPAGSEEESRSRQSQNEEKTSQRQELYGKRQQPKPPSTPPEKPTSPVSDAERIRKTVADYESGSIGKGEARKILKEIAAAKSDANPVTKPNLTATQGDRIKISTKPEGIRAQITKIAQKIVQKKTIEIVAKKIPFVGLLYALGQAGYQTYNGNYAGAAVTVGSAAASTAAPFTGPAGAVALNNIALTLDIAGMALELSSELSNQGINDIPREEINNILREELIKFITAAQDDLPGVPTARGDIPDPLSAEASKLSEQDAIALLMSYGESPDTKYAQDWLNVWRLGHTSANSVSNDNGKGAALNQTSTTNQAANETPNNKPVSINLQNQTQGTKGQSPQANTDGGDDIPIGSLLRFAVTGNRRFKDR